MPGPEACAWRAALDYYLNAATGNIPGPFRSVEHPDGAFTGTLN
ncbi:MAG TPA: hypothetical protein VGC22_04700 [Chitinophaga sp.]